MPAPSSIPKKDERRVDEAWRKRIGRSLRSLRDQRGMTQVDLGAAAGIDWTTVSGIERGESAPDFATIETLADVLGVGLDLLVGRKFSPDFVVTTADGVTLQIECKALNARGNDGGAAWEGAIRKLLGPLFTMTQEQADGLQGISFSFTPPAAGDGDNQRALPPATVPEGPIAEAIRDLQGQLDDLRVELQTRREPAGEAPKRARKPPRSA